MCFMCWDEKRHPAKGVAKERSRHFCRLANRARRAYQGALQEPRGSKPEVSTGKPTSDSD
jgi:hypothetical protein